MTPEDFLLRIEANERQVCDVHGDYRLFALFPFFFLVHAVNREEVFDRLFGFESGRECFIVRFEGCIGAAFSEEQTQLSDLTLFAMDVLGCIRVTRS